MTNPSIEVGIAEILKELQEGQKKILDKVEAIDKRLIKVETRLDSELPAIKEDIKELKSTQKAQVWTLIGILFTAVTGFLVTVGKFVFSGSSI